METELTQEYYARAFGTCYSLDTVSLRYFNAFGPRQSSDSLYAAVIPTFIALMLKGESPAIFGDGGHSRDFTYIDNVVDANIRAALCPEPLRGEVVNIGAGGSHTLNDLVFHLNRILGTAIVPTHLSARVGDVQHRLADIGKAERLFGYVPGVDFVEGLERTMMHFRKQRNSEGRPSARTVAPTA